MFRKDLIEMLEDNPLSVKEIAQLLGEEPKVIEDDVHHLIKSLKNLPYRVHIKPAKCKKCGFDFSKDKLHKPGKCPMCKGTWIEEPTISIEEVD